MACSAPSAKRRMMMRGRPSSRSSRTRWSLKATVSRIRRPGLCGMISRQLALSGAASGRLADAEVLGAARVGGDDQAVAVVLDRVLVAVLARRHQARLALGPIGVDQVDLGGLVIVRLDGDEARRTGSGRRRRRSRCPSPRRPARPPCRACRRGGGRRTAAAGWRRAARRTASGCRRPRRWRCACRAWRRAGPCRWRGRGCGW